MAVTSHVKGVEEACRMLEKLPAGVAGKVLRRSVRDGAVMLAKAAKIEVPVDTGALRLSIKPKARRIDSTTAIQVDVTAGSHLAYYAEWVHDGHHVRRHTWGTRKTRAGNIRRKRLASSVHGFVPGNPFLERATTQTQEQIVDVIRGSIVKHVSSLRAR